MRGLEPSQTHSKGSSSLGGPALVRAAAPARDYDRGWDAPIPDRRDMPLSSDRYNRTTSQQVEHMA